MSTTRMDMQIVGDKMNIYQKVNELVFSGFQAGLIEEADVIYARNQILSCLQLDDFKEPGKAGGEKELADILEDIVEYAVSQKIIENYLDAREMFASKIMNVMLARPSEVNRLFHEKYREDPVLATNYFYALSKNSNYIQMKRIAKNIEYKSATEYGDLDITINLSKPEKDPLQIAKERETKQSESSYPKCLLCIENEGYTGRVGHPARSNHRMIRLSIEGEPWYLQYSPYVYYNEHCILLSEEHRPMKIGKDTFTRLLAFVAKFPHYFIGSNADIPIVGGSILSHDHYQGGNYEFAMAKAEHDWSFDWSLFPDIQFSVLKWPMSVVRLRGKDRAELIQAADRIYRHWKSYSDPVVDILSFSNEVPHNTITPIARKKGGQYELDLVLRNNRTSEQFPFGIFHPHEDVHHIKKENIGLIEVMGLAVLPARLELELAEVEKFLQRLPSTVEPYHVEWAEELGKQYGNVVTKEQAKKIIQEETGKKFLKALSDAGVFKRNQEGRAAFQRFICSFKREDRS